MNLDKIEKKLPEEIVSLIDHEASLRGATRHEVVALLISSVKGSNLTEENRQLRADIEVLEKLQDDDKKEIKFLREEIRKFSSGLTSLAVTLGERKGDKDSQIEVENLSLRIKELGEEIILLKQCSKSEESGVIEKNLPLIMVSTLAALLLIYLIVSKFV